MGRCVACGGRGAHLGGCPTLAAADNRERVQRIPRAAAPPPAQRPRTSPGPPLLTEKVLGFRRWRLDGHRLGPVVSHLPAHWSLGPNEARCLRAYLDPSLGANDEHRAPEHDCGCGLYALHEPAFEAFGDDTVSGAVLAWGRIEVHLSGFRAEYAEPVALAYDSGQPREHIGALRSIAAEFYVPVVEDGELPALAYRLGTPIPHDLRPADAAPPFSPAQPAWARTGLTIADELLLVALCASHNGWRLGRDGQPRVPAQLDSVVASAELAELVARGRLVHRGTFLDAVNTAATGDAGLDAALARIADAYPLRTDASWTAELSQARPDKRRLTQLYGRGRVLEYERPARGPFGARAVRCWFAPEGGPERLILDCFGRALHERQADERTTAALAVMHAYGLHRPWFRNLSRREREQRFQMIIHDSWITRRAREIGADNAASAAVNGSL
jgi:Golgi phosphoprotein 3 (GPP34)